MHREDDLRILDDAVAWVRSKPEMFFQRGTADPIALLGWLMADVLELGMGSCTIRRANDWWIIAATVTGSSIPSTP